MSVVIIDPTVILLRARGEAARLERVPRWAPAFSGAAPQTPLIVQRLDEPGQYYYIVSYGVGPRATARLRMDAYTGGYAEGIGIGKDGDALTPYRTAPEAYTRLARAIQAEAKKKKKTNSKLLPPMSMEPFPVWRPCAQSFSAFLPFYQITVGSSVRYVRFDGKVYDALTYGAGL
jgi:hypothetical protein